MSIFIGGAWPYANGSLHLGHIAALLPGDILARYYRLKGEEVLYASGSDCNGTPIAIRANAEGVTTKEIANRYHKEFKESFEKLGFSFDIYTRTDTENHHQTVQALFLSLLEHQYLYKKEMEQTYCEHDQQFLPDRYVEGNCPVCGKKARGDQCDHCSTILDPLELSNRICKLCGNPPTIKKTEHFYLSLAKLQKELEEYVSDAKERAAWRSNAIQLSERYLSEGLQDRAASRDLPNGVSVPVKGFEDKKIYVWIEAVSGYYSASLEWAKQQQKDAKIFWKEDTISYYVHGKDNIPFHTLIWPAILMGVGQRALPTHIISNEYLTLEKRKLSTSQNWAVWVPYALEKYDPDSLRYFLTINAPENRDADFSWREFIYSHNAELLGAYGNLVNRTLKFIEKSFAGLIPVATIDQRLFEQTEELYQEVGVTIEKGSTKNALELIFSYIRQANKQFDEEKPWVTVTQNPEECRKTLSNMIFIIANAAQLLAPFLPFSSEKVREMLALDKLNWEPIQVEGKSLEKVEPLFTRIDPQTIERELERLQVEAKGS